MYFFCSSADPTGSFLPQTCLVNSQTRKKRSSETKGSTRKPPIDIYINPDRRQEIEQMEEVVTEPIRTYFKKLNMTAVYPDLFQLLWYSQLPCFPVQNISEGGLLARCEVAGQEVDCRDIFQTVATDEGICCAFNAKDVLKSSGYEDLIQKMRGENEQKYNPTSLVPKAGKKNGLKITLDAHYDKVTFGSIFDDAVGMRVFVGEPEEFVVIGERGKVLEPGKEHFLKISGYVIKADQDLMNLPSKTRKCFMQAGVWHTGC